MFEMKVRGAWSQRVGNFREGQIVCGYQLNRTELEQVAQWPSRQSGDRVNSFLEATRQGGTGSGAAGASGRQSISGGRSHGKRGGSARQVPRRGFVCRGMRLPAIIWKRPAEAEKNEFCGRAGALAVLK